MLLPRELNMSSPDPLKTAQDTSRPQFSANHFTMPFQLDPEVAAEMATLLGGRPPPEPVPVGDIQARRTFIDTFQALQASLIPRSNDVTQTDYHTTASNGHKILLRWYAKKDTAPNSSAIFYMHGGGMIASAVSNYDKVLSQYVSLTSVPFLSVEYRLAPEHPYPTPLEDCYTGLTWLHTNAHALSIDTARIAIMGDSAGGGLAACLTHLARERDGPPIAKQILIYPMLDDRTTDPDAAVLPFVTWNYLDNETAWAALLGAWRMRGACPSCIWMLGSWISSVMRILCMR